MIPKFAAWCEHFVVLPNGEFIRFERHQRRILDHVFRFDRVGRLPYSAILYSCVKKSGKTEVNANVVAWWAFNVEPPNEIIIAANKFEQAAGRVFRAVKRIIRANEVLNGEVTRMTENQIALRNGTTIQAIPNDYGGEAGSNHGLTSWDELWGYTSERDWRLYEELTPVPTRRNSIRFITSYAGFEGESQLLEDRYSEIFDDNGNVKEGVTRPLGEDFPAYAKGDLFVYWDHQARMPWQTAAYYEGQRKQLRTNTYLRLHENRWVSSESSLFNMENWDACVDSSHSPPLPGVYGTKAAKGIILWVGVDASVKKDRSAVVSIYREDNKIKLGPKRFWQPSKKAPMDLEATMEAFVLELHRAFTVCAVLYDPYQFHRSATTLAKQGVRMREFPQTQGNLTECGQNLYDFIEYGGLIMYPCKDLRYEATCAVGKETERGLRIVKTRTSAKIDQIIALAMAAIGPTKYPVRFVGTWGTRPIYSHFHSGGAAARAAQEEAERKARITAEHGGVWFKLD